MLVLEETPARAMYYLVALDRLREARILMNQCAAILASVRYTYSVRPNQSLADLEESTSVLLSDYREWIMGGAIKAVVELSRQSKVGIETSVAETLAVLKSDYDYRLGLAERLGVTHNAAAQLQVATAPDYPRPVPYHGLDQQAILLGVSSLASEYQHRLHRLHRQIFPDWYSRADQPSYCVGFHSIHEAKVTAVDRAVYLMAPWSAALLPRYYSVLAHELAHGFVSTVLKQIELTRTGRPPVQHHDTLSQFLDDVDRVLNVFVDPVVILQHQPRHIIVAEVLADIGAMLVAGPGYLFSLAWSIVGCRAPGPGFSLSVPQAVRFRMLMHIFRGLDPDGRWQHAFKTPIHWLEQNISDVATMHHEKQWVDRLAYSNEMAKACFVFVDAILDKVGLDDLPMWKLSRPNSLVASARNSFLTDLVKDSNLQYGLPLGYDNLIGDQSPASVQTALWLAYFNSLPTSPRSTEATGSIYLMPEGRLFHEWLRTVNPSSSTAQIHYGDVWELILVRINWSSSSSFDFWSSVRQFKQRVRENLRSKDLEPGQSSGIVGTVLGGFDVMALVSGRRSDHDRTTFPYVADKCERHVHFAESRMLHEVAKIVDGDNQWVAGDLKPTDCLAITFVEASENTPLETLVSWLCRTDGQSASAVRIFRSFSWDTCIVVWRLPNGLRDLRNLHNSTLAGRDGNVIRRSVTHMLWSVVPIDNQRATVESDGWASETLAGLFVSCALRVAHAANISEVKRRIEVELSLRSLEMSVEYVFGLYDLVVSGAVGRGSLLSSLLDALTTEMGNGAVINCTTTIGIQADMGCGEK